MVVHFGLGKFAAYKHMTIDLIGAISLGSGGKNKTEVTTFRVNRGTYGDLVISPTYPN